MRLLLMMAMFLQGVPPRALVMAMLLSYVMCFAGLTFAFLNYRKRKKKERENRDGERKL